MLSKRCIESLSDCLDKAIDHQIFPGAVVGMISGHGDRRVIARGKHTYDAGAACMDEASVFDVASVTKVLPTSTCALKAWERGDISLDDRVVTWLPELTGAYRERITFRHLLTHTIVHDFRLSSLKNQAPLQLLQSIFSAELSAEPGERFFYSNTTSILLGLVVERLYECSLKELLQREIADVLGLKQTGFDPWEFTGAERIVPTEDDPWRGRRVCGEVHDESAWVLRKIMYPGSAGLFTTVPDLLTFLGDMLAGYGFDKSKILSRKTIESLSCNQVQLPGVSTGLGWELNQRRYMGRHHSDRTIGKTGFTGCVIMADLTKGMGLALLANFTWPVRKKDPTLINNIRQDIADIVFAYS